MNDSGRASVSVPTLGYPRVSVAFSRSVLACCLGGAAVQHRSGIRGTY